MSSVSIEVISTGLDEALAKIDGLANIPRHDLTETMGRLVQGQTRRRIMDEKTAPSGAPWKPNSARTSTLLKSGNLHDAIDYRATDDSVQVGVGVRLVKYARIHQYGGEIRPKNKQSLFFFIGNRGVAARLVQMPARPYLGLSDDNRDELVGVVEAELARLLQP